MKRTINMLLNGFSLLVLAGALSLSHARIPQPGTIDPHPGPQTMFDQAARSYEEGDLTRARALYEALLDQQYREPEVYFNLGNTYFRKGHLGKAILNFRRAQAMRPRDGDTNANLRFALDHAGAMVPAENAFRRWASQATLNEWLVLASLCWWIFALLVLLRFRYPERTWLNRLLAMAALATVFIGLSAYEAHRLADPPEAVLIQPSQPVRSAPLPNATLLFELPEGSLIRITGESGEWYAIRAGNQAGWIRQTACQRVAKDHE